MYRERGRGKERREREREKTRSLKYEDTTRDCRSRLARLSRRPRTRPRGSARVDRRRPRAAKTEDETHACGSDVGGTGGQDHEDEGRNNPLKQPTCFRRFSADCFHLLATAFTSVHYPSVPGVMNRDGNLPQRQRGRDIQSILMKINLLGTGNFDIDRDNSDT